MSFSLQKTTQFKKDCKRKVRQGFARFMGYCRLASYRNTFAGKVP